METKRISLLSTIWLLMAILLIAQGNAPQKEISEKERAALYRQELLLDAIPDDSIELRRINTIPDQSEIEQNEIFFKNAMRFSIDERGHSYIPDGSLCTIYEFGMNGKYVGKFNKKGQGPGELITPNKVLVKNGITIVHDGFPRRISYYDKKWNYKGGFSYYKYYSHIGIDEKGFFYAASKYDRYMIDVLNENGERIINFGERPYARGSSLNNAIVEISKEGIIWVGMEALGIIKKYNNKGDLRGRIDVGSIGSKMLKMQINTNKEWDRKGMQQNYQVIRSISFIKDDVLVQVGGSLQPIYRYDQSGRLKKKYHVKPSEKPSYKHECKAVVDEKGNEKIYIFISENEDRYIGVYVEDVPKRKGEKE